MWRNGKKDARKGKRTEEDGERKQEMAKYSSTESNVQFDITITD